MHKLRQSGQATIEYVLVLVMVLIIGAKVSKYLNTFLADTIGNLAHTLSIHLTVGVCRSNCWFSGYKNGPRN